MDLRNQIVIHKKYGKGTIIEHSDNRLLIKFGTENSIRFIYPDSFEDNLVAKDSTIQSYIIQEIQKNKELDLNKKAEKILKTRNSFHIIKKRQEEILNSHLVMTIMYSFYRDPLFFHISKLKKSSESILEDLVVE